MKRNIAPSVLHGDCRAVLRTLRANSFDACVTDPPYGLGREPDPLVMLRAWLDGGHYNVRSSSGFMGKKWDAFVPQPAVWEEVFRVLKPGAHVLAFFGTRTYDIGVLAIRLAGFEVRDCVMWVHAQGFPKSLNVSKMIDKAAGAERPILGQYIAPDGNPRGVDRGIQGGNFANGHADYVSEKLVTGPATDAAREWSGYGTALKPAMELIVLARKPLSERTVAANVLKWGTGALNIDGCRVPGGEPWKRDNTRGNAEMYDGWGMAPNVKENNSGARWPANVIHDGSEEVVGAFPESAGGGAPKTGGGNAIANVYGGYKIGSSTVGHGDSGSAARFFYCAKASRAERASSKHPTVKPQKLMRYLCRLVTPPGGRVLDPFAGSGSTGEAAIAEGFAPTLIERERVYVRDIHRRLDRSARGARQGKARQGKVASSTAHSRGTPHRPDRARSLATA